MAIKLKNPNTRPAMIMDNLHVDQLLLRINRDSGVKTINAQGTTYGLDASSNSVYDSTDMNVAVADFAAASTRWAIDNGQAVDPVDAYTQLQAAKAAVALESPNLFTLMAYFEQATGLIFEIAGKAELSGVE